MAHLSQSTIFSPSAARQQLATTKDWNYVDGWLTTQFNGKPGPPFERNNDTLKALLSLAALNETADEDCELLRKAKGKAVLEFQTKEANNPDVKVFQAIENSLPRDGHANIDALSFAGVKVCQSSFEIQQTAHRIEDLQKKIIDLEQAGNRAILLHKHLKLELDQVTKIVSEVYGEAFWPAAELSRQSHNDQRRIKSIATRIHEMHTRIRLLSAATLLPDLSIADVKGEEDKFLHLMTMVKALETDVKSYQGLPHDTDLARLELEKIRMELSDISKQRDGMFEGLVERESPTKRSSKRP